MERQRLKLYALMILVDSLMLLGSYALAALVYDPVDFGRDVMLPGYLLLPIFLTIALYSGTYSRGSLVGWRNGASRALLALVVAAAILNFVAFFAKMNSGFSRVVFLSGMVLMGAGIMLFRAGLARWIRRMWGASPANRLIIASGGPDFRLPDYYHIDAAEHGLVPDIEDPDALDRLAKYLRNMDEVVVSCSDEQRMAWAEVLKGSGIHGEVMSDFARQIGALGVVHYEDADVATMLVSTGHLGIRARATKRAFDLSIAIVALVLLSPVMLACAILIKLETGGPGFFVQRRMGRGNRFFQIYKFRSMREADSDGVRSASKDDERITRVGRFIRRTSIDELPQLLNVIRGEMSIVGPRPHALGSLAGSKMFWQVDRKYWQRHGLRPGITGLAQIRGFRGATQTEDDLARRLQADLEYLREWSLWNDVKIVFATLKVIVHDRAF